MAITYDAVVKTARMNATRGAVANGTLEVLTAADAVLVTYGLDATAGAVSGNVWTLGFDAVTVNASATGVAVKARIKDSSGNVRVTGLVVGENVSISNANLASGQSVEILGGTITHA